MKVVENTPDRLVLREAPWIFGCVLIGFILLLNATALQSMYEAEWRDAAAAGVTLTMCGLAFVFMIRRDELILDRQRGVMEVRHRTVFGHKKDHVELNHLEQASTQTHHATNGNPMYRVALTLSGTPDKDVRNISPGYSRGPGAKNTADTINAWLKQAPSS